MRLEFSPAEEAFRHEVRHFVRRNLAPDIQCKVELGLRLTRDDYVRWYRKLHERGWITPGWPVEHGGTGWTPVQRHIFDEETLLGGAPRIIASGINMLGPVLIAFGTEEQKRRYLPAIRRSETWWAQGFSEPGAGSDLASMRTSAVPGSDRNGDHFIVNGHKVWTSYAQWCEMMFCLARTDLSAKPQQGISFLLIDLRSPGVEVRSIRTIDGGDDLNEVYLEDVRVPAGNLVGEVNRGWSYAKYLLGHERTGIAGIGACKQQLSRIRSLMATGDMQHDTVLDARVAELEIELMALEFTGLRMLGANRETLVPDCDASLLKVRGTELRQAIHELLLELAGPCAVALADGTPETPAVAPALASLATNYLDSRKLSIYGGTNEIQRNMIARAFLSI